MCVTGFVFRFFQYSAWCAPAHGACIHPPYMQAPTLFDKEGNMSTVASPGFKTVGEHLADGVLPTARQSLALLQACSQSATVNVCLYAYSQDNPCFVLTTTRTTTTSKTIVDDDDNGGHEEGPHEVCTAASAVTLRHVHRLHVVERSLPDIYTTVCSCCYGC